MLGDAVIVTHDYSEEGPDAKTNPDAFRAFWRSSKVRRPYLDGEAVLWHGEYDLDATDDPMPPAGDSSKSKEAPAAKKNPANTTHKGGKSAKPAVPAPPKASKPAASRSKAPKRARNDKDTEDARGTKVKRVRKTVPPSDDEFEEEEETMPPPSRPPPSPMKTRGTSRVATHKTQVGGGKSSEAPSGIVPVPRNPASKVPAPPRGEKPMRLFIDETTEDETASAKLNATHPVVLSSDNDDDDPDYISPPSPSPHPSSARQVNKRRRPEFNPVAPCG